MIEDDLVFITNGCCTDTSCYGDQNTAPDLSRIKNGAGESWDLWKNIAAQAKNGEYGNPDKFCDNFEATNWMSATVETSDEEIIQKIISICKRDPREGKVTTGGIVTVKDSTDNWYLSWTINRQPQFKAQDKNTVLIWVYALTTNKEGNYVKKAMRDCTGEEVCREWLYHIGVPTDQIDDWAKIAAIQQPASCHTSMRSSSQEKKAIVRLLFRKALLILHSWDSLQRHREILFSQQNTPSVRVWKQFTHL